MGLALLIGLLATGGWLEVEDRTGRACLDAQRLEATIARHLGRTPFPPGDVARVRAIVRQDGRALAGRLEVRSGAGAVSGSREIVARSGRCADLESALAVSLVLALTEPPSDSRAGAAAVAEPLEPGVAGAAPARPPVARQVTAVENAASIRTVVPAPAVAATGDTSAAARTSYRARLGAGAIVGGLPGLGFGPTVGGSAERSGRSLAAEGRFEWALPVRLSGTRVQSWRATGTLLPCLGVGAGQACAGLRAGLMWATAARTSTSPTFELTGRMQLAMFRGITFYAEPAVSLVRTRLTMLGAPAWTMPRFSAGAGLLFSTR